MERYLYSDLASQTSVRFVRLMPGSDNDIYCELFESNVSDIAFIALSYSWGGQSLDKHITITTSDSEKELGITSNLFDALWHLRHPSEQVVLWADAICINQDNVLERNHQVRMIANIYRGADRLIIWLGKDDESTTVAINLIKMLAPYAAERASTAIVTRRILPGEWQRLRTYLQRDWFERMWVIQELVLGLKMSGSNATVVKCGTHTISWACLVSACRWARDNYPAELRTPERAALTNALQKGFERVLFLHDMAIKESSLESSPKSLEDWARWMTSNLPIVRSRKATDSRDKLFALYGICDGGEDAVPDYTLSVSQVYHDFARRSLMVLHSVDILHEVDYPANPGGCSWVPDWKRELNRTSFRARDDFNASPDQLTMLGEVAGYIDIPVRDGAKSLYLPAIVVDEVVFTTDVLTTTRLNESWPDGDSEPFLVSIWSLIEKLAQAQGKEFSFDDFAKTIITNAHYQTSEELIADATLFWDGICNQRVGQERFRFNELRRVLEASRESASRKKLRGLRLTSSLSFLAVISRMMKSGGVRPTMWVREPSNRVMAPSSRTYRDLIQKWAKGRVFFTTAKGHMGLGVPGCSKGDRVAVLSTGRTPFILRPVDSPRNALEFNLVGDAYVHGMMNWEKYGYYPSWQHIHLR